MNGNNIASSCCRVFFVLSIFLFGMSCSTKITLPESTVNPAPVAKFSDFKKIEMKDIVIAPDFAEAEANQKATRKIQENLDANLSGVLASWNGSERDAPRSTLLIEPVVTQIKFIGAAGRVMVGAMAGNSAVVMEVTFKDKESGEVIAAPQFFQRAQAISGAYSYGVSDNMMLTRIAQLVSDYVKSNYEAMVGGPTGTAE